MRHLLARELERLFPDQLGQLRLRREIRPLLARVVRGTLRKQCDELLPQGIDAVAGDGADGVKSMEVAELRAAGHLLGDVTRLEAVDLVQRDHDRDAQAEDALGDEAVAGADPLAGGEHEKDSLHVFERLVDGALHALGERVARTLETGQVGEHELVVVAVHDPHDAAPGRLRLVGDDRDLSAAERVYERRFPDVRPPDD